MKTTDYIYFRPIWTCGRYNAEKRVAIYYNLLEGFSYFFEDDSADVLGKILETKRGQKFTLQELSLVSKLQVECLRPFLNELVSYGLLTTPEATFEHIETYRQNLIAVRKEHVVTETKHLQEITIVGNTDAERMYMERVGYISSVMFELTYRCSEMCIHCYNAGASRNAEEENNRGKRQELTLEEYKRVIDELYEGGLFKVCLTGGDPFSKNIVWDIIEYLYEKEIAFDIFTNGISVTTQVGRLAGFFPRTIGISLYSNVPEVHDSITRVKGSHDKTLNFIQQCSMLAMPIILKCCIMNSNVKTYYTVKDVARRYGALPQFDVNITDSVEGDKCASTYLRLGHEALEVVFRDPDLIYYIGKGEISEIERDAKGLMCNAGHETLCITPEGIIQPCCAFPMNLGNVRDGNIYDVLTRSELLSWWRSKRLGDCKDCDKYEYCKFCQMCAGNNYISHGNPLKASENNCFIAKERYELHLRMMDGYDPLQGKSLEERLAELQITTPSLKRLASTNYRNEARINGMS